MGRIGTSATPQSTHPEPRFGDFLLGLLLLALLLGIARAGIPYIQSPDFRLVAILCVVATILFTPILRRSLFRLALAGSILAIAFFCYRNKDAIAGGDLTLEKTLPGLASWAEGNGALARVTDLVAEERARLKADNYTKYIEKVDSRAPAINNVASRIVKDCDDADHLCETAALLRFTSEDIAYRSDPRGREDYIKSPQRTLESKAGDCEDKTILLISLLESLGNNTYMVFTQTHAYPLVCYNEPLDEMLNSKRRTMSLKDYRRYLGLLAPHHNINHLKQASQDVVTIPIHGRHCYPLEPTAKGSWIGYNHQEPLIAVLDPISGEAIASR